MKKIWQFFHIHNFLEVRGTWKPTGEMTVSWSAKIVPEYQITEECRCGKTRIQTYYSLADEIEKKIY